MKGTCSQCGCAKGACCWAGILLLISGLVLAIPQLYYWLSDLVGGTPIIQIVVGIMAVIVSIIMMAAGKKNSTTPGSMP